MNEIYDFIKKCGTYYLATVEDGQPRNRPFGTINLFDGKLYIQTGKSKEVSKQIQKNPHVEICCFDGSSGQWLRLAGELVRDENRAAKADMLSHYPELQKMYSADDDNTEVLYFKNATATFSSFASAPRTVKF
ncbi:MAG: pyridoxamine 5'-phosphate oxidase family protein [Treponema sp.]|nr:pyridoxamine 5'-phosphate oxidase family protein [Treponema sp.]MBQ2553391.1 pyridoxamine 5'-phosphate oxidase family protein [Treponema sp.]MBQ4236554.1 pyridoxamine 5'-phosphate oxidase family protein [Treponema sp.]